jgi:excinuclease ABC subunit A
MNRSTSGTIQIEGAREHNLRNLSLAIPRSKFVVVTGVSGSGKSTLAFDILFNEGQRRFLDSMGAYARQFVEQLPKPDVDRITGLPPTVSIEQNTSRGGGKSTVATVTEIHHFIRLLYAKAGTQHCPACARPVQPQTRDEVRRQLLAEAARRGALRLLAPVVRNRKGFHSEVARWAAQHGYTQIRADGRFHDTRQPFRLGRFREHDLEILVGTLPPSPASPKAQPSHSPLVDTALTLGQGTLFALDPHDHLTVHSTERVCPHCQRAFQPLDPKQFSYNSAQGWCPRCRGFGELFWMPEDVDRGERADAIEETWWRWQEGEREPCPDCHGARLNPVARAVRLNVAQASHPTPARNRSLPTRSASGKQESSATAHGPTIVELGGLNVTAATAFFARLRFQAREAAIARDILPEISSRLRFLEEVGLGYLELHRAVPTLSGGESQRIRLAAQLGSNLSGVLYVLDEPTIGLHARDNHQLLHVLQRLRARGNSIVVVEHDEDTMRAADYIVDLGPGAGARGGNVMAAGTLRELMRHKDSITGQHLRAQETRAYPTRGSRRPVHAAQASRLPQCPSSSNKHLTDKPHACAALALHKASVHNLKNLTVQFPLNRFVCVTGVSGSGKSTLIRDCLLPALHTALTYPARQGKRRPPDAPRNSPHVTGHQSLAAVHEVDQSPIGRTPRSVPATYVGFFDDIRRLFSQVPEARMRGYGPGRFSFNSPQGRCPECQGAGVIKLEMNFLPPAFVRCETCQGTRFNPETLDIEFNGRNIAQVLDLSVEEALTFFGAQRRILRPLQALHDTGLDYLKLGQTSPTLSGGEAQRVKLVSHLLGGLRPGPDSDRVQSPKSRNQSSRLFILEEPTIGLHMADIARLVEVLQRLVDAGHSVIVIEHNLELVAESDWVIDLGPEGGDAGGRVVAQGTPEQIARHPRSHTGRFLRKLLPPT